MFISYKYHGNTASDIHVQAADHEGSMHTAWTDVRGVVEGGASLVRCRGFIVDVEFRPEMLT